LRGGGSKEPRSFVTGTRLTFWAKKMRGRVDRDKSGLSEHSLERQIGLSSKGKKNPRVSGWGAKNVPQWETPKSGRGRRGGER